MAERVDLTVDDLGVVQEELYETRIHWYNMGLKLELKVDTLDTIATTYSGDPSVCFREMLKGYLRRVTPLPSWRTLVEALRSPTVQQPQLAKKIERRYCRAPKLLETEDTSSPLPQEPLPNAHDASVPVFSPVSETMSETLNENELHGFAMQISTNSALSTDEEQQPKDFGCGCGECSFHSFLEKGCPKPILSISSFPYLNTEGLNHSQKRILEGRLYHEYEMIATKFSSLLFRTRLSLIKKGVTAQELVQLLMTVDAFQPTLPRRPLLEDRVEKLQAADTIDKVFLILRDYRSFFSYHIIEHIIRELGTPKDEERLKTYSTQLDEYSKRSVFECPSFSSARKDQANLVVKLEGARIDQYTSKHLGVFQSRVSNIVKVSKYTLRLCTVEQGCLQLTFQIPHFVKEVIFPLSESQKTALQDEGVTHLTCDDYQCSFKKIPLPKEAPVAEEQQISNITLQQSRPPSEGTLPEESSLSVFNTQCVMDIGGTNTSKMQPPDKKKFEREVFAITQEIREKEAKLKPVPSSPSQDISSQLTQITGGLSEIKDKKGSNTAEVRRIEDQLKKRGTEIIQMRDNAIKLSAGLRHKSEGRIDEMAGKLEQQLQTKQFSATGERRLQLEIDALKKSKERLKEYQETKEQVEKMRNEQDQLRKRRDSLYRSTRDLRGHESELKDQQAELKKGLEEKRDKQREFKARKDVFSKEIDALYKKRTQLREDFRQQQAAYLEATKEERQAERAMREEEARKREEDRRLNREARRRKQVMEMEMQRELLYDEEKTVCRVLIAHLQRLSLAPADLEGPSFTSLDQLEAPPSPTTRSSAHSTVADKPGEFLPRKTEEQEDMLFPPSSGRRRSRRGRKRYAPTIKASKRLNYDATMFAQFSFLSTSAPTTQPEIASALAQLQEKLAFYECKSVSKPPPSEAYDSGIGLLD